MSQKGGEGPTTAMAENGERRRLATSTVLRVPLNAATCYRAVCARDARADGRFFTCVQATGVFCRPVCPSRTPRRKSCLFVATAAAASALGFRPCRRCRPQVAPGSPAWALTDSTLRRALRLIENGALDDMGLDDFAGHLGLGVRHLRRLINRALGVSPNRLAVARRSALAYSLLEDAALPMTSVAEAAGFRSLRRFNHVMKQEFGASPSALRATTTEPRAHATALRLRSRGPVAWPAMAAHLGRHAVSHVERVVASQGPGAPSFERWLEVGGRVVALTVTASRDASGLEVRLRGAAPTSLAALSRRVRRAFDLDTDAEAVARALAEDAHLRPLVERLGPLRLPGTLDPFEAVVRVVVGQQVSLAAARTVLGRLAVRFAATRAPGDDAGALGVPFPTAAAVAGASVPALTALGLTAARARVLLGVARASSDGALFEPAASLEALLSRFQALEGIGPWTAHVIALRAFGEADAFPANDLILRRAASRLFGRTLTAAALEREAARWAPWRGYAAQYLWTWWMNREVAHALAA